MSTAVSASASLNDPRYPIGRFQMPERVSLEERRFALLTLAELPEQMREAVRPLDEDQRNAPYRPEGWTVRQLVHHVADSHSIAFTRARLALTEDWPEIKPYNEKAFALLADVQAPLEWSLEMMESIHARWVMLLQALTEEQWARGFRHAERGPMRLDQATLLYAWHSRHHVAHITHLRAQQGW